MKFLLLFSLLSLGSTADGYRILCIFSMPSRSHNLLGKGIVNALLKAGHEVTWLTPFPPKEPPPKGLTIIDGSAILSIAEGINMSDERNAKHGLSFIRWLGSEIFKTASSTPALRAELTKGQYDAVVTEFFFSEMDAGYAAVLQVPWIMLSGMLLQPKVEVMVDDVMKSIATVPMLLNDFPIPMNFWQRCVNVGMHYFTVLQSWWAKDEVSATYEAAFKDIAAARGVPLPPLDTVIHNVSVLFVNSHSSFAPAQSLPPNVVDIGGFHIDENVAPLPKDLQDLLDASTQGVVYFSMGSVIKSAELPLETRQNLLKVFAELPYTVLWKFEEEMTDLPKNVHIRPWMPQAAILAHKNTKVFITHGGLLSSLEALHFGVPLIAVPVFGDQPSNAARAVRAGYALRVDYGTATMFDELRVALKEMLANDSYYKKAKYLSFLFNKRPVAPSTLIPHYVEIAIETKGAYHLRSKSKQYWWFQRSMIDQLVTLASLLYILYRIAKKIISIVIGKLFGSSKKVKKN